MRLTKPRVKRLRKASDLRDSAKLVLALYEMGVTDRSEILKYFVFSESESAWVLDYKEKARKLIDLVLDSKLVLIRKIIDYGLPRGINIKLPYAFYGHKVFCGNCNASVNVVPCVLCNPPSGEPNSPRGRKPPLPKHPTMAFPGTQHKILVMQQRLARGEAIFHPEDMRYG